jgi:hypothetical protein
VADMIMYKLLYSPKGSDTMHYASDSSVFSLENKAIDIINNGGHVYGIMESGNGNFFITPETLQARATARTSQFPVKANIRERVETEIARQERLIANHNNAVLRHVVDLREAADALQRHIGSYGRILSVSESIVNTLSEHKIRQQEKLEFVRILKWFLED